MKVSNFDEASRWFIQAEDELEDAIRLKNLKRYYLALYLSQQSAEKALKAFLYYHGVKPLLTHSVSNLIAMALEIDKEFETVLKSGRLDDYYLPTRYPNGLPGGIPSRYYQDEEEVEKAIELSKMVLDLVRKKIQHTS